MKSNLFNLLVIFLIAGSFQSCMKDKCEREITYIKSIPVYHAFEDIRIEIKSDTPRGLHRPGKIYFYENYIFINEIREGVHIIDNNDPENPQEISFIPIPGNIDIAIRGNILYADNYTDLLAIDISNIQQVRLAKRSENVFPNFGITDEGVLTHYDFEEVTETIDCNINQQVLFDSRDLQAVTSNQSTSNFDANGLSVEIGNGLGGSFARFTIYDQFLYTVDESSLNVFDISRIDAPEKVNELLIGWAIETIYPFKDHLFIGSNTGMFIYDLVDPSLPQFVSQYWHWTGCDPVFAKDNYAYVTIRTGTNCNGGAINQLQVIDITDLQSPFENITFEMESPHGLSIRDNALFLCEGEGGLKIFDIEDPLELNEHQLAHLDNFAAYDVINIPGDRKILLLIGDDGFFQFDVEDPSKPQRISHIPVIVE